MQQNAPVFHLFKKESPPPPAPFDFGLSVCVDLEYPFAHTVWAVPWMDFDVLYVLVQCSCGRPALPRYQQMSRVTLNIP